MAVVATVLLVFANVAEAGTVKVDPTTLPPASSDKIKTFALAVAHAEGFPVPGAIPTRANNPGDLVLGGNTIGEGITVFATPADGWKALYHQLELIRDGRSNVYSPYMSISEMGARYAPKDPDTWSGNVADFLGVDPDTQLLGLLS